jgi:hypothetical protein
MICRTAAPMPHHAKTSAANAAVGLPHLLPHPLSPPKGGEEVRQCGKAGERGCGEEAGGQKVPHMKTEQN